MIQENVNGLSLGEKWIVIHEIILITAYKVIIVTVPL